MNLIKHILITISLLLTSSFGAASPAIEKVDISGTITNITLNTSASGKIDSIFVEGSKDAKTLYDKATVRISNDTVVLKNGKKVPATTDYLQKELKVDIQFTGPVMESYPIQATADIINIVASEEATETSNTQEKIDPIVNAYALVIDSLYEEDPGLNGDIKYLAVDTTKMTNLTPESKKQLIAVLKKYKLEVLDTTFEKLEADGLIKDLYFEKGLLFRIEDQSVKNDKLTLSASKWRSGLGAIGIDKMVLKKVKNTGKPSDWEVIDRGGMWIS